MQLRREMTIVNTESVLIQWQNGVLLSRFATAVPIQWKNEVSYSHFATAVLIQWQNEVSYESLCHCCSFHIVSP
jgi:hypothetical protein